MVFEEEIGSVKGHIGPLKLVSSDAKGKTLRQSRVQLLRTSMQQSQDVSRLKTVISNMLKPLIKVPLKFIQDVQKRVTSSYVQRPLMLMSSGKPCKPMPTVSLCKRKRLQNGTFSPLNEQVRVCSPAWFRCWLLHDPSSTDAQGTRWRGFEMERDLSLAERMVMSECTFWTRTTSQQNALNERQTLVLSHSPGFSDL